MISVLVLYVLLSTACFYLGSRARITSWLWSRYPTRFARFMDCPACTGFWWGVIWASAIQHNVIGIPFWPMVTEPILIGLCMIVLVPIAAGLMQMGFERTGSAVSFEE